MAKRKKSKKSDFDKGTKSVKTSRSFWTNAGQNPMPAVNIDRPFDFDVGFPNRVNDGFAPYLTGSAQYVTTTVSIPDDWCNCAAFDLSIQRLYQAIRENLKSNLSYTVYDLKAYIATVTWLQAICSCINRDFAFLNFRDAQHPTFEHIWGKYASYSNPKTFYKAKLCKGVALDKQYLIDQDMATSLTYIDNVLIPKMQLLLLPPVASEFCKWLFDSIYVDEINPSRSQWYWTEIESIPMYRYAKLHESDAHPTFYVSGHMSTYTMALADLAAYVTDVASTYGVIIADLRRCGAQMVSPLLQSSSERRQIMKYDDNYFYALRNAYTSGWLPEEGPVNPNFFIVDFYEGMTNDQMCTALCLAGGITNNAELVKPMVTKYQSILIETDHTMRLFTDPLQTVPGTSVVSYVAQDNPGVYYMSWTTGATSSTAITSGTNYEKATVINPGVNNYGFMAGSWGSETKRWRGNPDAYFAEGVVIGLASCRYNGNPTQIVTRLSSSAFTKLINEPAHVKYQWSGPVTNLRLNIAAGTEILNNGSTDVVITYDFYRELGNFTEVWQYLCHVDVAQTNDAYSALVSVTNVSSIGTVVFGDVTASSTMVTTDPSKSVFNWVMQEVDHHIPIRASECGYDISNDDSLYTVNSLIKETGVTTMYTREELSSLMYSLDLSLFMVHANSRNAKQA